MEYYLLSPLSDDLILDDHYWSQKISSPWAFHWWPALHGRGSEELWPGFEHIYRCLHRWLNFFNHIKLEILVPKSALSGNMKLRMPDQKMSLSCTRASGKALVALCRDTVIQFLEIYPAGVYQQSVTIERNLVTDVHAGTGPYLPSLGIWNRGLNLSQ